MAKLYKVDGTIEEVKPKNKKWSLEELQHHVGGDIILVPATGKVRMIANEEGEFRKLPYNERASRYWLTFPGSAAYNTRLLGPVLVLEPGERM